MSNPVTEAIEWCEKADDGSLQLSQQAKDDICLRLGRAFISLKMKSIEDQDSRGWNKAFNAVWQRYSEILAEENDAIRKKKGEEGESKTD